MASPRGRRGQLFFLDGLFAAILVILILLALFSLHASVSATLSRQRSRADLELRTLTAAALLVETTGSPQNWSRPPDAHSLGLSSGNPLEISPAKLSAFSDLLSEDPASAYRLTGFSGSGYGYAIRLLPHDGTDGESAVPILAAGAAPAEDADEVIRVVRYARYNGTDVRFELRGWSS